MCVCVFVGVGQLMEQDVSLHRERQRQVTERHPREILLPKTTVMLLLDKSIIFDNQKEHHQRVLQCDITCLLYLFKSDSSS